MRLAKCNQAQFFARYGEAARVLGCFEEPAESVAVKLFELHKRHGRDVKRVLDDAVKAHSGAIVDRSLPASCLVRMVLGSGTPEPPAAPAEPPLAENVFRRNGQVWQVRFAGGKAVLLVHGVGAAYLHMLLQRPGVPLRAVEMAYRMARCPERFTAGGGARSFNEETLTAYRAKYQDLQEEIEEAERDHDEATLERARRERRQLADEIRKLAGLGGRARQDGDDRNKVRSAVYGAIRRTIGKIAEYDRRLAEHLRSRQLRCGHSPCYSPVPAVAWDT